MIGVLISIPLGVIGALRRGSKTDHTLTVTSVAGFAVPQFWMVTSSSLGSTPGPLLKVLNSMAMLLVIPAPEVHRLLAPNPMPHPPGPTGGRRGRLKDRRYRVQNRVEQVARAAPVQRGHRPRLAEAQ